MRELMLVSIILSFELFVALRALVWIFLQMCSLVTLLFCIFVEPFSHPGSVHLYCGEKCSFRCSLPDDGCENILKQNSQTSFWSISRIGSFFSVHSVSSEHGWRMSNEICARSSQRLCHLSRETTEPCSPRVRSLPHRSNPFTRKETRRSGQQIKTLENDPSYVKDSQCPTLSPQFVPEMTAHARSF